MNRYQIYLDPHSVATIDEAAQLTGISRSQMIRGVIDRYAQAVMKVLAKRQVKPLKKTKMDSLVGLITLPGSDTTNYATRHDSDYLQD